MGPPARPTVRQLAALLFLSAAVDWPALVLDRAGVALAGFAVLSLTIGRYHPRPARMRLPKPQPSPIIGPDGRVDPRLMAQLEEYLGESHPTPLVPGAQRDGE